MTTFPHDTDPEYLIRLRMAAPTFDVGTYARARADGQRAIDALRLARWIAEDRIPVPDYGSPSRFERDGWDITLSLDYDEGMDMSDIGYGRIEEKRPDYEWPDRKPDHEVIAIDLDRRSFWYYPVEPLATVAAYYHKAGASKSVALDMARAQHEAEAHMAEGNGYGPSIYVLRVTVSRAGIELGSASVGGIEIAWSDITRTDGSEYLAEVAENIIPEAIADAEAAVSRLSTYVKAGGSGLAADVRKVVMS